VRKKMKKYALSVEELTLYFEKESLRKGDVVIIKRSQVKTWKNNRRAINKLFFKKGKSEKRRDRNVDNYEIKLKVGNEIGYRAPESVSDTYQAFSASIIAPPLSEKKGREI